MNEERTGPAVVPVDVSTPEDPREHFKQLREKFKAERENSEIQAAIAAGLVCFFTWVATPFRRFLMLHAFPNRAERRRRRGLIAATRSLSKARKPKKTTRTTLAMKRAAARLVVPANDKETQDGLCELPQDSAST